MGFVLAEKHARISCRTRTPLPLIFFVTGEIQLRELNPYRDYPVTLGGRQTPTLVNHTFRGFESLGLRVYLCLLSHKLDESRERERGEREREMSYLLPHLHSGWAVDQSILAEEERLVVIRFGHDWDETCMQVTPQLHTHLISFYKP